MLKARRRQIKSNDKRFFLHTSICLIAEEQVSLGGRVSRATRRLHLATAADPALWFERSQLFASQQPNEPLQGWRQYRRPQCIDEVSLLVPSRLPCLSVGEMRWSGVLASNVTSPPVCRDSSSNNYETLSRPRLCC